MEIVREQSGSVLELRLNGRLDAYWADHLGAALDEALRAGADDIRLDMAEVAYMSSVGIRVLLRFYKETRRLQGALRVRNPSAAVRSVLELAGLQVLLFDVEAPVPAAEPAPSAAAASRRLDHGGVALEVFDLAGARAFDAEIIGDADLAVAAAAAKCHALRAGDDVIALGTGAFGRDFEDCRARFGELVAAGGAAAFLPTDGSNAPDSLVATGAFVPELLLLNGIACRGRFAQMARFDARAELAGAGAARPLPELPPPGGGGRSAAAEADRQGGSGVVALSALVDACLAQARCDAAALVVLAESAGLMGAALRRSPVSSSGARAAAAARSAPAPGAAPVPRPALDFTLPEVRQWLSFTPERAHGRGLALIVGVAARGALDPTLAPFLRPLAAGGPAGHFHAAAFTYQPLRRGALELAPTLATLFESAALEGVLHLIHDDRPIVGGGESELVRGACWVGPIAGVGRAA